jgi:hypothetical protein
MSEGIHLWENLGLRKTHPHRIQSVKNQGCHKGRFWMKMSVRTSFSSGRPCTSAFTRGRASASARVRVSAGVDPRPRRRGADAPRPRGHGGGEVRVSPI